MKFVSAAVLFFLIVSNLGAFDRVSKDQPGNSAISGFRDVAAEQEVGEVGAGR